MSKSVLTDKPGCCFFTGSHVCEVHHIFPGSRRAASERRGFTVPLAPEIHREVHDRPNHGKDLLLKQLAQRYYESHIGSRKDFIREFMRSYL